VRGGKLSSEQTGGKPLAPLVELRRRLGRDRRLMGLDVGAKTIGIALSDAGRLVATPLLTLRRTRFRADAERLAALIGEHDVGGLVVGLPVNMDGSEGPRCQSVRQFAANLHAAVAVPVVFWDERLSTLAVERAMIEADLSRRRRAQLVDKVAAAYILQGALDASAGA
jgi:putative Holliday junction resolvase